MVPSLFVELPSLPKTATGKIDRAALPAPVIGAMAEGKQKPRTAAERVLAAIWAEALGLSEVGIDENFFALGGDSIINIQVVARAKRAGLRFSPRDLFAHPTVAGLAAVAKTAEPDGRAMPERTGPIPLLPMQCQFLHRDPVDPDYFEQSVLLEIPADLEVEHLRRALDAVVRHHAAFRLRFRRDGDGRWTQIFGPAAGAGFAVLDTPEASAAEAAIGAARLALDLERGPLLQARLLRTGASGARPDRLLIVIHHLITDGVTWRMLLSDLEMAYRQVRRGDEIALPPCGTSVADWAHRLCERAASAELAAQLDYWLAPARARLRPLPMDRSDGPDLVASERRVTVGLPASRTHALLAAGNGRADATAEEVLVAALALALSRFCGTPDVLVDLEAHGREDASGESDLSRTAGWLTALYPVVLHAPLQAAPGAVLRAVRQQLRAVPERGLGYGLLRYLSPDSAARARLDRMPQAEVLWNYLGQLRRDESLERPFGVVTRSDGFDRSPRAARRHAIEINTLIDGDTLQVEFTYSIARHDRGTIEALAFDYLAMLDSLIDDPPADGATRTAASRYAPSDFPDAELSEQDLALLVSELEQEGARTP
jgi:non-ribosomal peptide synthase protein (TIGR01720 family)